MKSLKARIGVLAGLVLSFGLGMMALVTPADAKSCEPVVCPAIAKLCPDGQFACYASKCNCTLVCPPPNRGCRN